MRRTLCRRCGAVLDRVLLDAGDDLHPRCRRERGDEHDERAALRALAVAFGGARVIQRAPRGAR